MIYNRHILPSFDTPQRVVQAHCIVNAVGAELIAHKDVSRINMLCFVGRARFHTLLHECTFQNQIVGTTEQSRQSVKNWAGSRLTPSLRIGSFALAICDVLVSYPPLNITIGSLLCETPSLDHNINQQPFNNRNRLGLGTKFEGDSDITVMETAHLYQCETGFIALATMWFVGRHLSKPDMLRDTMYWTLSPSSKSIRISTHTRRGGDSQQCASRREPLKGGK